MRAIRQRTRGRGSRGAALASAVTAALALGAVTAAPPATASPAAAAKGGQAPCSTDIINGYGGEVTGRHFTFSYQLAGPSCRNAAYVLVVHNMYTPRQTAVFVHRGDGVATLIDFDQTLPFVPRGIPSGLFGGVSAGFCVTGVTVRRGRVDDVAPDPAPGQPPCLLLVPVNPGTARAFH